MDNNKVFSILSYITLVGWIIALILYQNEENRTDLLRFHLRQALGLMIASTVLLILGRLFGGVPFLDGVYSVVNGLAHVGLFILWILGLLAAINGEKKPVPILGEFFEEKLDFIR